MAEIWHSFVNKEEEETVLFYIQDKELSFGMKGFDREQDHSK